MKIAVPPYEELEPELKKFIQPQNEKMCLMLAKGLAPVPAAVLISSWAYFAMGTNEVLKTASLESLKTYPEKSLLGVLPTKLPGWALHFLGLCYRSKDDYLELILLNEATPNELFLFIASICNERLTNIIANNQERIIELPDIVAALEKNPANLKSNTDRLRQFLKLAGIFVPGEVVESPTPEAKVEAAVVNEAEALADEANLTEEKRLSLLNFIHTLSTGAKVKLALKGNKEARGILIRDTNKTVCTAVLRSPRITENEIALYSSLKHLSEDVIRDISKSPTWTKNYGVKLNLVNHPKTPLQDSMGFIKFLSLRDLNEVARSKTTPVPLRKAAKQLLATKRK